MERDPRRASGQRGHIERRFEEASTDLSSGAAPQGERRLLGSRTGRTCIGAVDPSQQSGFHVSYERGTGVMEGFGRFIAGSM